MRIYYYSKQKGFNLIELVIVVAIIGILVSLAYPTYQDYLIRAGRSDGQAALLNMASYMESYYTEQNSYTGATSPTVLGISSTSNRGYYTLSVSALTATSYTLTATPVAGTIQANDSTCGALTLTNANVRGPSASCWE